MKCKMSTLFILLLVAAITLSGLAGCTREPKPRPTEVPEKGEVLPTIAPETVTEISPTPGQTVVSVVTPSPTPSTAQPVATPGASTVAPVEPTATTAPAPAEVPTAEPPTSTEGGVVWHTVQRGETLSSIARAYGTTWQAIARANSLVNPDQIYVGQKLKVPKGTGGTGGTTPGCRIRHIVRSGEWVWQIARNYGVSPYDILAANGLTISVANTIYPGQVLCIP